MKEYAFDHKKLANVQSQLVYSCFLTCQSKFYLIWLPAAVYLMRSHLLIVQEKLVAGIYHLNNMAKDAYRSYILAYNAHSMRDIFNVHRLDLLVKLSHDFIPDLKHTVYEVIYVLSCVCACINMYICYLTLFQLPLEVQLFYLQSQNRVKL